MARAGVSRLRAPHIVTGREARSLADSITFAVSSLDALSTAITLAGTVDGSASIDARHRARESARFRVQTITERSIAFIVSLARHATGRLRLTSPDGLAASRCPCTRAAWFTIGRPAGTYRHRSAARDRHVTGGGRYGLGAHVQGGLNITIEFQHGHAPGQVLA